MKIKIAVCDGKYDSINKVEKQIKAYGKNKEIEIVLKTYCYEEVFLRDFESRHFCPDILFLDTSLRRLSGIDVAEQIRGYGYTGRIIFATISEDHYLEAFDVHAYHYLLKHKISDQRFEQILDRCIQEILADEMEYILLTRAGEIRKIALERIRYFETYNHILTVHYLGDQEEKTFEYYSSLGKMEHLLFGHGFIRCHRAYLVSVAAIEAVHKRDLLLTNGRTIPMGRVYVPQVKEVLQILKNPVKFQMDYPGPLKKEEWKDA